MNSQTAAKSKCWVSLALFIALASVPTASLAEGAEGPVAIPIPMVASEKQGLSLFLAETLEIEASDSQVAEISEKIEGRSGALLTESGELGERLAHVPSLAQLSELEHTWAEHEREIRRWARTIEDRAASLERRSQMLQEKATVWELTAQSVAERDAPEATRSATSGAIADLKKAEEPLSARLASLLSLQQSVATLQEIVSASHASLKSALTERRATLLSQDAAPVWQFGGASGFARFLPTWPDLRLGLESELNVIRAHWNDENTPRSAFLLLIVASLAGAIAAKARAKNWAEDDVRRETSALLLRRPYSVACVAALGVSGLIAGPGPRAVESGIGLLILPPALRVLSACVPKNVIKTLPALAIFYVVDRVRGLLGEFETLERVVLAAEFGAALLVLIWLLRPRRTASDDLQQSAPPWVFWWATRIALVLLVVSLLANAVGYVGLARLLGNGVLTSTYVGVAFYGLFEALTAAFTFLVQSTPRSVSRAMALHGDVVRQQARRILGGIAILGWLYSVLGFFEIRDFIFAAVLQVIEAGLSIGDFTISIGDVGAFGLAVLLATYASRFVRFLLQVEVFPRVALGRGLPNAISSMTHYGILMAGLYIALAAAGVDLSKLTLLMGALGVGIGFGLQNVVNNFISGLILLFERPVQVGDTIDVGDMLGRVKRIGIRSSTLRTFTGSEVIVPNSELISNRVTNWTLSDPIRRIDIPIGVAYGTDPERVLSILREIAEANEKVQRSPAPEALFSGFGDSSENFELRVWIQFDDWYRVNSEINVAIHHALAENEIEIPFPQRDLHLRSVEESIATVLGRRESENGDSNE